MEWTWNTFSLMNHHKKAYIFQGSRDVVCYCYKAQRWSTCSEVLLDLVANSWMITRHVTVRSSWSTSLKLEIFSTFSSPFIFFISVRSMCGLDNLQHFPTNQIPFQIWKELSIPHLRPQFLRNLIANTRNCVHCCSRQPHDLLNC